MQVNPCAGCGGITSRSRCLGKSGNDTERHRCACVIDDVLVERFSDGNADRIKQLICKVEIGILDHCIADREVSADLVAVDLDVIKPETQLVERRTHFRPHAFRNCAHDILASLAADALEIDAACKLAVRFDDLPQQRKHYVRNGKTDVCQCSLFFDAFTRTRKECFYVVVSEQRGPLLLADGI